MFRSRLAPSVDGPTVVVAEQVRALPPESRTHRRSRSFRRSQLIVGALMVGAGVGGAFAGCHPTGTPIVDPLYTALFAAAVTLAASRAGRATLLILAAVGAGLSREWLVLPGAAALLVAFASVFPRRARHRVGALVGALSIQVLLRWPHIGFHGLTALAAAAAIIPCFISALRHISSRGRRWVLRTALGVVVLSVLCTVPVAVAALVARAPVNRGVSATEGALTSVSGGATAAGVGHLASASGDFAEASARVGSWWTAEGLLVPLVAQQRRVLAGATTTGRSVTATAARLAATVETADLGYGHGRFDLDRIRSLQAPIDRLDASLRAAQGQLAGLRSAWVLGPVQTRLDTLGAKLATARSSVDTAALAVRAAPGILGGDGVRHYFIAFMTPSESRGLDGFIGAYGELVVDNGRISLTRAGSVTQLNQVRPGTRRITGPADYLARYGAYHPQNFFQDLSYSPDFPTVEQVIAQMYPQSGGDHIDGVLALDPEGLAALLQITGPVTVAGSATPLTSANAASFLLKGEYDQFGNANAARHNFLQEGLSAAFHRLLTSHLPATQTLARALNPEVRQGRILFWTDDPKDQPLLYRLGVAGSFPRTPGKDVLAVTTMNSANNKIDAYLYRRIDDRVNFDPATGQTRSTLTVTLHNAAPATGLPSYVLGSYTGSGLPNGTNKSLLSIYSPLQLVGATIGGTRLYLTSEPELGVNTFSTYVDIASGQTVTLRLALSGDLQPGPSYALTVRNQPMVNPDVMTATVRPVTGWRERTGPPQPWEPAMRLEQTVKTEFRRD